MICRGCMVKMNKPPLQTAAVMISSYSAARMSTSTSPNVKSICSGPA